MDNEQQQVRTRKNCGKLYRKLLNGCDLIMDDEKILQIDWKQRRWKSLLLFN